MTKIKIKRYIPVCYSGSLIQQNYGESINNHGFMLWDINNLTYTFNEVKNDHKFYKMTIKSLEDLDNNEEIITNL